MLLMMLMIMIETRIKKAHLGILYTSKSSPKDNVLTRITSC